MIDCSRIQQSLEWCQGTPALPGVMRRVYFISKRNIVGWPTLKSAANDSDTKIAEYEGSFTLKADQHWKFIDVIPEKSQLTSEAQGEAPSQTQLNKLTLVHPGTGILPSSAAMFNNDDLVFLVQDMNGNFRVVGSEKWTTKTTLAQDLGQGATGTTSTTISVEASDEMASPFYTGVISTDEGTIAPGDANDGV